MKTVNLMIAESFSVNFNLMIIRNNFSLVFEQLNQCITLIFWFCCLVLAFWIEIIMKK